MKDRSFNINGRLWQPTLYTSIVVFLLFAIWIGTSSSGQTDGKAFFKKGKMELDSGRYADAVESLQSARKELPLLADYATLFLSEAYHGLGDYPKSLETIRTLLNSYPQSTLRKKARSAEIREAREADDPDLRRLYEAFVHDYPDDEDITLAYGLYLKDKGEKTKAVVVFRGLYIKAGSMSRSALAELDSGDIRVVDLIERASNLMKHYEFREAEKELRKALKMDEGRKKMEILRDLGQALFKQKEYKEATSVYRSANDLYWAARSSYRAGDKEGFESLLSTLIEKNDRKAGQLLLASAADKRRAGEHEVSVKLYSDVLVKFPSEEEEALWGIGWARYLSSDYKKASETFSRLYRKYGEPKYLYWQARCLESLGEDPKGLYASAAKADNNFYSFLSQLKLGAAQASPASFKDQAADPSSREAWMERVEVLKELGMKKEVIFELACISSKTESQAGLLYIITSLYEMGEYKRAVTLAVKLPYSLKTHRLWYPLAYWDQVSSVAGKYDFDPMLALSVMREESRFDAQARSVAGARGLMQLMPATAYRLDKSLNLGIHKESHVSEVKNNISLGVYYLKSLSSEFKSMAHALAAYNAGEAAVRRWQAEGGHKEMDEFIEDIPYAETRNYVKKVLTSYFQYKKSSGGDIRVTGIGQSKDRL